MGCVCGMVEGLHGNIMARKKEKIYILERLEQSRSRKNHFSKLSFLSLELFEPKSREHCSGILKVLGTELRLPVSDQ